MIRNAHIELLGRTAKDRVTGFTGVIVTVSFDLFGCVQVVISPPVDKDGKKVDDCWFDVNRLDLVGESRAMPVPDFAAKPQEHKHGPAAKPRSRNQ